MRTYAYLFVTALLAIAYGLGSVCIADAATPAYLWAVVPSALEPDWLDHPQAETVVAQWRCYEVSDRDVLSVDPRTVTGATWLRVGEEERSDGKGVDADYRADKYVIGGK